MAASQPALPGLGRTWAAEPRARREQMAEYPWEARLLVLARVDHPSAVWWHGYRHLPQGFGAVCYVCNTFIVGFSPRWPPPQYAKRAIEDHKVVCAHRSGVHRKPPRASGARASHSGGTAHE